MCNCLHWVEGHKGSVIACGKMQLLCGFERIRKYDCYMDVRTQINTQIECRDIKNTKPNFVDLRAGIWICDCFVDTRT